MTNDLIENQIEEAQDILASFGLPERQHNKISALTLLALCNIKPGDSWHNAVRRSMTLSKDIMEFVNSMYDADYKANTRESFRKIALKPFVDNNIALLNPDDHSLKPTSANTHYSISDIALAAIKQYKSASWEEALIEFKKNQFTENTPSEIYLKEIIIKNYKSIYDERIDLGKFNVFIGANGSGKSNILEALAAAGAGLADEATFEGFYNRGIRVAKPDLIISSFLNSSQNKSVGFDLLVNVEGNLEKYSPVLHPEFPNDIYTKWITRLQGDYEAERKQAEITDEFRKLRELPAEEFFKKLREVVDSFDGIGIAIPANVSKVLTDYAIFDINTKSLRGITPADSRKTPLGINGEGLDLLIANFNGYERHYLQKCDIFFDWLDEIMTDSTDKHRTSGIKSGRGTSTLFFTDRYMQKKNNILSAENSNEGILHVLFYFALFISNKTPSLFAIDNIETALNPRLCKMLIEELAQLSKERGKQVLITTHNPAILDGLNLFDDDQRLFEVFRNDEGHTKTRRIVFKDDLADKPFKLSTMWTDGLLGAVPKNFF